MKTKALIFLFFGALLFAENISENVKNKSFNIDEFYKKSQEKNPNNPSNFQTQEILNNALSEKEMELSTSGNASAMKDEEISDYISEDERKVSKHYIDVQNLEEKGGKSLIDKLKEQAIGIMGDNTQSSQRVSCYIARSQSFYQYTCDLRQGSAYGQGMDNTQSPDDIKELCMKDCYKPSTCELAEPVAGIPQDFKYDDITINKANKAKKEIRGAVIGMKIQNLSFTFSGKQDVILNFYYINKTGERINLARDLVVQKGKDNKPIKKQYVINDYVDNFSLDFSASDSKTLQDNDILISDLTMSIRGGKHWVCMSDNIRSKSGILKLCRPEDIVEFKMKNGDIVEVCKSQNEGDNGDGSYSTQELCQTSCRVDGKCTLIPPVLSPESFFGFSEGCLTGDKNCSTELCREARENLAPIMNEWVYDGDGNRVQTIKNGIPVANVVRPRILASQSMNYQEKIREETKLLARQNMIQEQTYVLSTAIGEKRETSYASSVDKKSNMLSILIKPTNEIYGKTANLYIVVRVATTTPDWKTDKELKQNFKSEYYYIVDSLGNFKPFYRKQGLGLEGRIGVYETFNGKAWKPISEVRQAELAHSFYDVYNEVLKNKYYIKHDFGKTTEFSSKIKGIPYVRKFIEANTSSGDIVGDNGYDQNEDFNSGNETDKNKIEQMLFTYNYGYKSKNFVEEIYSKKEIESLTPSQKMGFVFYAGDFQQEIQVFSILTHERLTYKEVLDKVQDNVDDRKSKNDYAIWNDTGNHRGIKSILKGDEIEPNSYFSIFLVGEKKNLSAYANIKTEQGDKGENAYFFLWFGKPNKQDPNKGNIQNIQPDDSLKIHDFTDSLFSKYTDYEIFFNQDYSDKVGMEIGFGYGTGKFENKDCKTFKSSITGKTERICLPWWKIEREYQKKEDTTIQNADIRNAIGNIAVPMQGKKVRVCTKINPYDNAIYNSGSRLLTCTKYYSKLVSESCAKNPKQEECLIDTCSIAIKNNCKKKNVFEFSKPNQGVFVKTDDNGNSYEDLGETKVGVKGYTYECPATGDIKINHSCLEIQEVIMNPTNCGDTEVVESEDIIKGKSGWIYCDKNNPIYDSMGNIKGFEGKCPNGKRAVCGINQLSSITKVCSKPKFEEVTKKVVTSKTIKRDCRDVYVDVGAGEEDVYKDSPKCYRINSADDARGGDHKLSIRVGGRIPTMRFTAVNESTKGGKEEDIYCVRTGENSKLPSTCVPNSKSGKFVIDTSYTINGDSQILFVEQMGGVDNSSGDLGGIELEDTFDINNTFRFEKRNAQGEVGWVESNSGTARNGNGERNFWNNPRTHAGLRFPNVKHRGSDFNFYSSPIIFNTKGFDITMIPEVSTYNFQFLTKECTKSGYLNGLDNQTHPHYYKGRIFYHSACGGGCDSLGNCSHNGKQWWDDHLVSRDERALKVYKNAVVGLTIMLPSVSTYEITYFNRDGEKIMSEKITSSELKAGKVGTLMNKGFGTRIISQKGKIIRDKLIPEVEELIKQEEAMLSQYGYIKKGIVTEKKKARQVGLFFWRCKWNLDGWDQEGKYCYRESVHGNDPYRWARNYPNQTICLANYKSDMEIGKNGYNNIVPCDIDKKLQDLKEELEKLKKELIEESVYSCSSDMFSPVGGGTHFKMGSGSRHLTCDKTRSMSYIKKNSIYKVIVRDLESNKVFTKVLTFPMPYLNRIWITYLKEVDRRAYRCCQDF